MNVRRSTTTAAVALAFPVLSLGLTACGFDAPTDQVYNPAVGVNEQRGAVDVLNALVVSGSDGSGTVVASFANNDQEESDALTGISGPGVQVEVAADATIPQGGLLNLSDGSVTITGEEVVPGSFVRLTFTFGRGEAVTLQAPVMANDGDYADIPVA